MKTYVRLLADRQTTVLTIPSLDFNSMHEQSLRLLAKFFTHVAERVMRGIVILDVTPAISAGAGFLTEIHHLSIALAQKQVQLVIAGDLGGLFHLVGWERRFPIYADVIAAVIACEEGRQPQLNTKVRLQAAGYGAGRIL